MKQQHYSVSHYGHQVLLYLSSGETNNKSKRIKSEAQRRKSMTMSWPEIPNNCQYQARHLVPSVSWHRGSGH